MPNNDSSDVNSFQIGGAHYKSAVQHWDFTERNRLHYLEGCATKYVARWRKKNGLLDLQKAVHYVQKLRALFIAGVIEPRRAPWYLRLLDCVSGSEARLPAVEITAEEFAQANGLTYQEMVICREVLFWKNLDDLNSIEIRLKRLILSNRGED